MNYWISPTGKVKQSAIFGSHTEMALDIMNEDFKGVKVEDPVEFLHDNGYVRYIDWGKKRWVWEIKPTKRQIDKMFELTKFIYNDSIV